MTFELPSLPFEKTALEPHMSARTLEFHHGKHHQTYVNNLNNLVKETLLAGSSLEDIITATAKDESQIGIFNNAAQVWNHTFFWNSLKPSGGGAPKGVLAERLATTFGSLDKFKEHFKQVGVSQFGSGWVWLVLEKGELKITRTSNAVNPLSLGQTALLTCDVWEHAYYLDFQNRRPDFIQTFLDHLVNWNFAAENLAHCAAS